MVVNLILSWVALAASVWVAERVVPGVRLRSTGDALAVAAIFGTLNTLLGWLLFFVIAVGTLGVGLLLSGVTRWVCNTLLLMLTDRVTDRLSIDSVASAAVASLVISGAGMVIETLLLRGA